MSNHHFHNLLSNQLSALDLSAENPPTHEQWVDLLQSVDKVYARAEAVNRQKREIIERLALKVKQQSIFDTQNSFLERKLKETMFLNRMIEATTSTLEPNEILSILCRELAVYLKLPHTMFATLTESGETYQIVAEYLETESIDSYLGSKIPAKTEKLGSIFEHGENAVFVANVLADQENPHLQGITSPIETISALIVPLKIDDKIVGILALNTSQPRRFTQTEIAIVEKVAAVAGQSVSKATLYSDLMAELAERKATEVALEQARDEAMEASRIKSQLIAKVSHELRTPLNSIMGFAEMLQLGVFGPLDTDQTEILKKVLLSTEYLVLLVNDLLDMAKLESGRLTLESTYFSLIDLIDRVESSLRRVALKKGLNLYITLDPQMPTEVWGDIDRLYQILINLIDNAIKFTQIGNVHVNIMRESAERYALVVQDTGAGIPKEQQGLIFDQFQQASISTTQNHKGIGLGLSIVKQLVEIMEGTIVLESEVSQGSKFTISLPLISAPTIVDLHKNKQIRTSA